jgi:hypothetical protein
VESPTVYEVDSLDAVVELRDAPKPDIGAPLPLVLCDEHNLLIAYLVSEPDPAWDGSYVEIVSPESGGMAFARIRFNWPAAHLFGLPNDEAFDGHPLAARGLHPYDVFEVHSSSWIRKVEGMNSVHPRHNRERFLDGLRHFVFVFHDSTFECIADGFDVQVVRGSMRSAVNQLVELLSKKPG